MTPGPEFSPLAAILASVLLIDILKHEDLRMEAIGQNRLSPAIGLMPRTLQDAGDAVAEGRSCRISMLDLGCPYDHVLLVLIRRDGDAGQL